MRKAFTNEVWTCERVERLILVIVITIWSEILLLHLAVWSTLKGTFCGGSSTSGWNVFIDLECTISCHTIATKAVILIPSFSFILFDSLSNTLEKSKNLIAVVKSKTRMIYED